MSIATTIHKDISPRIDLQIPEHVRADHPAFVAFLKAYYEYMGQDSNAIAAARRLPNDLDIDHSLDSFLTFYLKEFIPQIPKDALVDKKLLIKHAKEFYRTRGSEAAYKLLFRIMWNDEIDFYYPGEDILRASDGRYQITKSIKISNLIGGEAIAFDGVQIDGQTSGSRARVVAYFETEISGVPAVELKISNIQGRFLDGEDVLTEDKSTRATILNTVGPASGITTIRTAGAFHESGDIVDLIDTGSGAGANGVVTVTSGESAVYFTIGNGGSGYRANSIVSVTHNGGVGASFRVDEIDSLELLDGLNTDVFEPYKDVVIGHAANTAWRGHPSANSAAMQDSMEVCNVHSTFNDAFSYASIETGSINKITTLDFGYGYTNLPEASVDDTEVAGFKVASSVRPGFFKGADAEIVTNRAPGSIAAIEVNEQGSDYSKFRDVYIRNRTKGTGTGGYISDNKGANNVQQSTAQDATGVPTIYGIIDNPGVFTDTKGFLSWNNKLQDNNYYQEFSYAIKSEQFVGTFKKIVNDLLHPAGTKLFGLMQINISTDAGQIDSQLIANRIMESEINIPLASSPSIDEYMGDDGFLANEIEFNYVGVTGGDSEGELQIQTTVPTAVVDQLQLIHVSNVNTHQFFGFVPSIQLFEVEMETQVPISTHSLTRHVFVEPELVIDIGQYNIGGTEEEVGLTGITGALTLAAGQLYNRLNSVISSYGSSTVAGIGTLPVGELGSARLLYGNNTMFGTQPIEGEYIKIIANTTNSSLPSGTANTLLASNTVYSNVLMSTSLPHEHPPLSNTIFYYFA